MSSSSKNSSYIQIKGARVHNLKNVDLNIIRNKLIVISGLSGSGKSSLAFDTLYAEGQRRYVESLSSYARQFLGRINKPEVDYIKGIPPAIAIEQKVNTRNPRSTVGTSTEVYDYLKLLFVLGDVQTNVILPGNGFSYGLEKRFPRFRAKKSNNTMSAMLPDLFNHFR